MKVNPIPKLDFNNVLIRPKRSTLSSRSEVNLTRNFDFNRSLIFSKISKTRDKKIKNWTGVPIISSNTNSTGTFRVAKLFAKHKMLTCLHKFYTVDDYKKFFDSKDVTDDIYEYIIPSCGMREADTKRTRSILKAFPKLRWLCLDVANGYMQKFVSFCREAREKYPHLIIVAGNVTSRGMTEELIINGGVNIVKVGIGPGAFCTTRLKTGIGVPQLSAIIDCADAAHGCGAYIIGDGGITCPGDAAKAFGGGADFIMMAGQFAGHYETPGDTIRDENGQEKEVFYGMSSVHAMEKNYGKVDKYRTAEGRVLEVKHKGKLEDTILDYMGGLRSCCTYINAREIKHIPKCTTFVLVSQQLNDNLVKK